MNKFFSSAKFYFSLAAIFVLLAVWVFRFNYQQNSKEDAVKEFQQIILQKDKIANQFLNQLIAQNDSLTAPQLFKNLSNGLYDNLRKERIDFFRYRNDTLRFWSTNQIPIENTLITVCLDNSVVKLKNGWYRVLKSEKKAKQFFVVYPIKQMYAISNAYLDDQFPFYPKFASTTNVEIDNTIDSKILDEKGNYLFSLHSVSFAHNVNRAYVSFIFTLLSFLSLFCGICIAAKNKSKSNLITILLFCVLAFRLFMIVFKQPFFFYELPLFSPQFYANSFFNASLGDLLLNVFVISLAVILLRIRLIRVKPVSVSNISTSIKLCALIVVHYYFSVLVIEIVPSFVKDSTIKFDPTNLVSLEIIGWLGLFVIGFLFLIYLLWTDFIFKLVNKTIYNYLFLYILISGSIVIFFSHQNYLVATLLYFSVHISFFVANKINKQLFSLHVVIISIVCVSFLFSFSMYLQVREKQINELRSLADNFSEERDPIAEYLFGDISLKIKNDTIFEHQLKTKQNPDEIFKRLRSNYFSGYWDKYNASVVVYDSLCNILLKPQQVVEDRLLFFEEIEKKQTSVSTNYSFFPYLFSSDLSGSYLGKIQRRNKKNQLQYNVYVELKPKLYYSEPGFPALLLEKRIKEKQNDFSGFSFAKYLQGNLVNNVGNYNYHTSFEIYNESNLKNDFFEYENYIHVTKKINSKNSIVVSRKSIGNSELLNLFSYWFLLLLFVSFFVFLIFQLYNKFNLFTNHLRNRIQALLVTTITIIFILIGWWNINFIKKQYTDKNSKSLNEKANSIILELQGKLSNEQTLNYSSNEYLNYLLTKFSNVFYTDLSLYAPNGNLLSSSRNAVFENGLLSNVIHPLSFKNLTLDKESRFIHTESIGKLSYLSAYIPFINDNGTLLAYLNLPYFSKQNELEIEISSIIVTLLNIYVLFFVLSISIAVFVSNRIVLPLTILQSKLKTVRLNKKNETIVWSGTDEIGSLIIEYNRMIHELTDSAEKLAQSEREVAWREMAKQVAHEIKNPLTPMKLNVQHFERVWLNASDKEKEVLLKKFSSAMIEQIDVLSSIASEFSNFAQLPSAKYVKLDIVALVRDVVHIFENTCEAKFIVNAKEKYFINGDKEQIVRVFNNLIKNSMQSIDNGKKPIIEINFSEKNFKLIISVSDNGNGISDEIKNKIFSPNFTTKSTGMGLGLAMVKNTIETHGGSISFDSEQNKGTIFTILLPKFL